MCKYCGNKNHQIKKYAGWTPELALQDEELFFVLKVVNWHEGNGVKPIVGVYVGPNGFTTDINQATKIINPNGDLDDKLSKKVDKVEGKSLVSNILISKLETDYSREEINNLLSDKVTKEQGKSLVSDSLITKLSNLDTKEVIDNKIAQASTGIAGSISPADPAPTEPGIYKAKVSGVFNNIGGLIAKPNYETFFKLDNGIWALFSETATASGQDGESILKEFDPNYTQEDGTKGYTINSQVRYQGITYVSLEDDNISPLTDKTKWESIGVVLDVEGGALSYEKGKRLLDNTVPKPIPFTRVPGTIVRDNGDIVNNVEWDTTSPINVSEGDKYQVECFQNPITEYVNWGRPAFYDTNMNFISFLGLNPDKDGYITPSKFNIIIPANGKMVISTLHGRTLKVADSTQDGVGVIYLTPDSLDKEGSALSYEKYENIVEGVSFGYGYYVDKSEFELGIRFDGLSSTNNSKSPKLPVKAGQKIEYAVGAEGVYLQITDNLGTVIDSREEWTNRGPIVGNLISPVDGFAQLVTNSVYEGNIKIFLGVVNNKDLITVGDLATDGTNNRAIGPVVSYTNYFRDTKNWKVFTSFKDIYTNLIEGQLVRNSVTSVSPQINNFWYYIAPQKFLANDLIRYRLTGFGAEPMYIIFGSNNFNDVKFVKLFELWGQDGNNPSSVEGELRVTEDCYIAFNIWNNPLITSLNYLKKGDTSVKVDPQYLLEKSSNNNSSTIYSGRKFYMNRPAFMELRITALPPTDVGTDRTPTYGTVDIVVNGVVIISCNMAWSIQGHGSASYAKKGYTFDLLNSEGKSLEIKFGDMISIDSFHLKAYATDATHSRDVALGRIWRDMVGNLPYPYSKVNNKVYVDDRNARKATIYTEDAKYHTDGIPCSVTVGGKFFGLYTLRLKKSRDNYALDRDDKNHIFLDSSTYTATYGKTFDYKDWDLKSPRISGYEEAGPITDATVLSNINRVFDFMANLNTRYAEYADYWVLPHWVDMFIHAEYFSNWDINGNNNNIFTWNGIHWSPAPYDLDLTVGLDAWSGGGTVRTARPQTLYINFDIWGTFRTRFITQIRSRYTELRKSGFLQTKNLLPYFYNQVKAIPRDVYDDDRKLWPSIWANAEPSLEQIGLYLESTGNYLDSIWLNP